MRLALTFACGLLLAGSAAPCAEPEDSVVRVVNYSQRGDWSQPWDVTPVRETAGSGLVIDGAVLTNAHVVSDSRMLVLFLHGDPDPHQARVVAVGHDCDLALVEPLESGLLARVPALVLGELPRLRSTVDTLGYPVGGTQVSSTRGVVSRIEPQVYSHPGNHRHFAVQTDAAINPGNSGGPVLQDGKVVGVAFEAAPDLQNVGYFIPTEVIRRFLDDVADGSYDGYPELGVRSSGLENPAPRRKAGMSENDSGVRVDFVYPGSSADGVLRAGDVLLSVDGVRVANDGSVGQDGLRFPYGMLIDRRQSGDRVALRVLRERARLELTVTLRGYAPLSRDGNVYDRLPRYFIYAGLIFEPLDLEMIKTFGEDWYASGDRVVLHEFLLRPLAQPELLGQERVILLGRLDHPVNANLAWFRNQVVERVNGRPVGSLDELIEAIESNRGAFQVIEFADYRRFAVLDRAQAEQANAAILERYGVARDRNL
ncbi:MAG TPA: trypsin-like peptidase domain-containing protein [Candidatus Polarisedimenticolaceae bacterium]|nr:trypsin-like peptidase domain-containing protein [Candidatus Polarisedimenticolaceae bacterium]